jgi:hypothetical protein
VNGLEGEEKKNKQEEEEQDGRVKCLKCPRRKNMQCENTTNTHINVWTTSLPYPLRKRETHESWGTDICTSGLLAV